MAGSNTNQNIPDDVITGCSRFSISHGSDLMIQDRHSHVEVYVENADLEKLIYFVLKAFPSITKEEPLVELLETIVKNNK